MLNVSLIYKSTPSNHAFCSKAIKQQLQLRKMLRFECYKPIKELGKGAFGRVIHAVKISSLGNVANGMEVAVKIVESSRSTNNRESMRKTAKKEKDMMLICSSPNVVALLEHRRDRSRDLLVMELGECSLWHLMRRRNKPMGVGESKFFASQVLRGLEYIHGKRIVHHDIKPENVILVGSSGHIVAKVSGFGMAEKIKTGGPLDVRSVKFSAPEVKDSKAHDTSADIYSLGVLILELLLACTTIEQVIEPSDVRPPHIADPLMKLLVMKLMQSSPTSRPTASTALADPAFFHFFFPTRLPLSAFDREPDMKSLEAEERALPDAPKRWMLAELNAVGSIESDAPRMLVMSAIREAIFETVSPGDVHIHTIQHNRILFSAPRCDQALSKKLSDYEEITTSGGIQGNSSAVILPGDNMSASDDGSVDTWDNTSIAETSEADDPSSLIIDAQKCSCGFAADIRLMFICESCLVKPLSQITVDELLQIVICGTCANVHHYAHIHVLQDASSVVLPRKHEEKEGEMKTELAMAEKKHEEVVKLYEEYTAIHFQSRRVLDGMTDYQDKMASIAMKRAIQADRSEVQSKMARLTESMRDALANGLRQTSRTSAFSDEMSLSMMSTKQYE